MDTDEVKRLCKKLGITARKYNGDDEYSWAIFVKGQAVPHMAGLTKSEVPYYKKTVALRLISK